MGNIPNLPSTRPIFYHDKIKVDKDIGGIQSSSGHTLYANAYLLSFLLKNISANPELLPSN